MAFLSPVPNRVQQLGVSARIVTHTIAEIHLVIDDVLHGRDDVIANDIDVSSS